MNALWLNENEFSFRYERKFIISQLDRYRVETLIKDHPAMFSEIFHERSVNNIYFDSLSMHSHYNNKCGTSQRMKVRIRWYNDFFPNISNPILEFKVKNNLLGTKFSYPLKAFNFDNNFTE